MKFYLVDVPDECPKYICKLCVMQLEELNNVSTHNYDSIHHNLSVIPFEV